MIFLLRELYVNKWLSPSIRAYLCSPLNILLCLCIFVCDLSSLGMELSPVSNKVFIGGVPAQVNEDDIRTKFRQFGNVSIILCACHINI